MDETTTKSVSPKVHAEYRILQKYLKGRFAEVVVLTFSQIEDLVGSPLPAVAGADAAWWTGAAGEPSMQAAWVEASRVAMPNLPARCVRFERIQD